LLFRFFSYFSGMNIDSDIFKIQSNNVLPSRGKILISEPFLRDATFGRSVILLVDHTDEGSMGLVINKQLPLFLNDIIMEFKYLDEIPLYKGGPIATDTLFYLHTLSDIPGSISISKGLYLNGDFDEIKKYILQGNKISEHIRFFLGYSGWESEQLSNEIRENTWLVSEEEKSYLMKNNIKDMWRTALEKLGSKYETWSRFPQVPTLN
jgi:putative transcriptional regulator